MPTNNHVEDLKRVITPALLSAFLKCKLPADPSASVDFSKLQGFPSGKISPGTEDAAWAALVALSKIPLDEIPDMMTFLPAPDSADFPEHCLGLVLLLDQGPRMYCQGVDGRWVDTFFGVIAQRLSSSWYALPAEQRPNAWSRWKQSGASFDYWLFVHFWMSAVFVHSESMTLHKIALDITEDRRTAVEERVGQTDPNRACRLDILSDTLAFSHVIMEWPKEDVKMHDWAFWAGKLMDVHWPIVNTFGRYPYRNPVQARDSTEAELKWLQSTNHMGEADEDTAKKIRKDAEAGIWTPLSEKRPSS